MPQAIVTGPVHEDALAPAQALPVRRQAVPQGAVAGFTAISWHGTGWTPLRRTPRGLRA